jgi:hypothetical protein
MDSYQGPLVIVAFLATVPAWLGLMNVYKFPLDNFPLQDPSHTWIMLS